MPRKAPGETWEAYADRQVREAQEAVTSTTCRGRAGHCPTWGARGTRTGGSAASCGTRSSSACPRRWNFGATLIVPGTDRGGRPRGGGARDPRRRQHPHPPRQCDHRERPAVVGVAAGRGSGHGGMPPRPPRHRGRGRRRGTPARATPVVAGAPARATPPARGHDRQGLTGTRSRDATDVGRVEEEAAQPPRRASRCSWSGGRSARTPAHTRARDTAPTWRATRRSCHNRSRGATSAQADR